MAQYPVDHTDLSAPSGPANRLQGLISPAALKGRIPRGKTNQTFPAVLHYVSLLGFAYGNAEDGGSCRAARAVCVNKALGLRDINIWRYEHGKRTWLRHDN